MSSKHLEPKQLTPQSRQAPPRPSRPPYLKAALLAGALIVVGGAGVNKFLHLTPDDISPASRAQLQQSFDRSQPFTLETVANAQTDQALNSLGLPSTQREALALKLARNPSNGPVQGSTQSTRLVWIEVWDFAQEDGDVVRLASAGFEVEVKLLNAHTRIAIPLDSDSAVSISGVRDGGGGITLAIATGTGPISLPVMTVGQTIRIPVSL